MILVLIFYLLNVSAQAIAGRSVVVNDQQLNATEIQYLDQLSCSYIADGNYWFEHKHRFVGLQGRSCARLHFRQLQHAQTELI